MTEIQSIWLVQRAVGPNSEHLIGPGSSWTKFRPSDWSNKKFVEIQSIWLVIGPLREIQSIWLVQRARNLGVLQLETSKKKKK